MYGKANYMNPLDTRQYLYCLTPLPDMYKDTKVLKGVTNIGKLDIVWKTNLGEKGRLQTSALQRVVGKSFNNKYLCDINDYGQIRTIHELFKLISSMNLKRLIIASALFFLKKILIFFFLICIA